MITAIWLACGFIGFGISGVVSWDVIQDFRARGFKKAYPEIIPWTLLSLFFLFISWKAFKVAFST